MLNERNYKPLQHKDMKYKIRIEETLTKYVEIEAESSSTAKKIAKQMYLNEVIVLTSDDLNVTQFEVVG